MGTSILSESFRFMPHLNFFYKFKFDYISFLKGGGIVNVLIIPPFKKKKKKSNFRGILPSFYSTANIIGNNEA